MDALGTRLEDVPYVVLDVETTGLDVESDEVVEIALLRFERGRVVDRFTTLVDPGIPIPPEASGIHLITDRHVAGEPSMREIEATLQRFVAPDDLVVAHNASFDYVFVPALADRVWTCSMRAARHLWPTAPNYKNQTLRFWLGLDDPRLESVAAHRAAGDALVTGLVFHRLLKQFELEDPYADLSEFVRHVRGPVPVEVFRYGRKWNGRRIGDIDTGYLEWVVRDAHAPDSERRLKRLDPDTLAAVERELDGRKILAA